MRTLLKLTLVRCFLIALMLISSVFVSHPTLAKGTERFKVADSSIKMNWSLSSLDAEANSDIITIQEARNRIGERVKIKGVVTADQATIGGGKLSTFVQDESAGINVYSSMKNQFPELKEGMEVTILGKITTYNGLTEIIPDSSGIEINALQKDVPSPKPVTIEQLASTDIGNKYEGQLIHLTGYIESIPSSASGGGYNAVIIDEKYNGLTLRLMEATNTVNNLKTGQWYEFTGILSRYSSLQLLPRKQDDIHLIENQPKPPNPEGEYQGIVDRVVDGDTIHLKQPVLGTTKVRFVNVDTPETYHVPKNELDENQLKHGKRASDYLKTKLLAGDSIKVKVGKQAKDAYGRLLSQGILKNGVNMNLDLVKKGFATTYFIWPVNSQKEYKTFQRAVKKAKKQKLGIWNPDDPLIEMPFEFRAREQGKGLTRYVGDSSKHTYVRPEEWKEVAVEHRIFFSSPEEAESAGYFPRQGCMKQK